MLAKRNYLLPATQLDRKLTVIRDAAAPFRNAISGSWIRALRQALGLSAAGLGRRMKLAQQSVAQLEENERNGTITLASLRRAAEALDAELIYAVIPRRNLRDTISERAKELAKQRVIRVAQSMQLEAQGIGEKELSERVTELTRELEQRPRELWR
jgi:predicted DNA-binding mobile mystery protein A